MKIPCSRCGLKKVEWPKPTKRKLYCEKCKLLADRESAARRRERAAPGELAAQSRAYREAHPEAMRATHIKRTFGITEEQYASMLAAQDGVCAICGNPPAKTRLAVDHSHSTLLIRGLLCHFCNYRIVGRTESSPLLRAAAEYLDRPFAVGLNGPVYAPKVKRRKRRTTRRMK